MKIMTKLKLAAWGPAIMTLIIGLILLFSYRMLGESQEKMAAAHRLMDSINKLNSVGSYYMLYPEERPKQQFLLEHDSFTALSSAIRLGNAEQERLLADLRNDSDLMRKTFLRLASSREHPGSADPEVLRDAGERLASQVGIRLSDMFSSAVRLEGLIDNEVTTTQKRVNALVLLLIAAVTGFLTLILIRMMRKINTSLGILRKGTEIIGSGHLGHHIGMDARDEIGELSLSFDRMTERLRDTTVSRDALMKEMEERKRAEQEARQRSLELQRLTDTLEQRVAGQTAEIRRTYDAVKAERQRLYDVLETLPAYVVLLAPDYHVPFANRFFLERFGESHGKRCFEYLFGRTEPCEICETYKVLKTKAPHHWEWTGPDGRLYDIYDFPFTDTDGSFLIMEMGIDVTERKRAEDALKEGNQKLRAEMVARMRLVAAVEQAGEGVAITNPEGVVDYVNPAFERISGSARREILGRNYYDVLSDEDLKEKIQGSLARDEIWSGRVTRRSDGQTLELDVTFSPIRDGSGAVINYLAMERDVTQGIRLEQHLRQMQKMDALGTLAGGIAHDFNNILNPIFINTELVLLDAPEGSPVRPPLQLVLEAAERGKNLVKQIITFSRQKECEAKPLKVEPLVKEALKFLRASLPSTVEIREKVERETGFILADPTQIHQVVMNLCSNAAHAMREKGGMLEVRLVEVEVDGDMARLHPGLKPGPYLRLTVSDTGVGMAREVVERAFDPFFTTKKPGEGSGIGLSVVQGIVRNAGGAITVYSEVGVGSTFNVFFPRVEAEGPLLKVPTGPVVTGRERILLIDDEEVQVKSIRNMLERLGYEVVAMTDSGEALSLFRKSPRAFDLVITDQTMPQMTGVKLAEELLRIRPDLPVILCTGFSETVDANGAQGVGVRQFLMKPFSFRDMAETIKRALQKI